MYLNKWLETQPSPHPKLEKRGASLGHRSRGGDRIKTAWQLGSLGDFLNVGENRFPVDPYPHNLVVKSHQDSLISPRAPRNGMNQTLITNDWTHAKWKPIGHLVENCSPRRVSCDWSNSRPRCAGMCKVILVSWVRLTQGYRPS